MDKRCLPANKFAAIRDTRESLLLGALRGEKNRSNFWMRLKYESIDDSISSVDLLKAPRNVGAASSPRNQGCFECLLS
jgi:hypothetical protein